MNKHDLPVCPPMDDDDDDSESDFEPCNECDCPDGCSDFERCGIAAGLWLPPGVS